VSPQELAERLRARFDDVLVARGEVTATVPRDRLLDALIYLREEADLAFGFLADVSCTDWPGREPRIWMAYHMASLEHGHRLRVKTGLPEDDLRVPSAAALFPAADWQEREVFDLFGVRFDGHPNLRRILNPDEWDRHPLLKTEGLGGVPTQYKGAFVPPPDERGI
jgi:NADH-quinone oxidoreductase subunit C